MRSLLSLLILLSITTFAQENESVLSAPETWRTEIIPFPLEFAPEIDFEGFEDIRFAPGWSDSTQQDFWAYSFVWYIEASDPMTEKSLTEAFNGYYDGLMRAVHKSRSDSSKVEELDDTICLFIKTDDGFSGKMRVFDAFFMNDYTNLNIKVNESFCEKTNKQIVRCDISPKPFDDELWRIFDQVKVKIECE